MMMSPICRKVSLNNAYKSINSIGLLPFDPKGSGGMTIDWGFYLNRPFMRPIRTLGFRVHVMEILAGLRLRRRKSSAVLPRIREVVPNVYTTVWLPIPYSFLNPSSRPSRSRSNKGM